MLKKCRAYFFVGVGGSGGQALGFSYEGSILDSRFFWQTQASAMVGTGVFAGIGISAQYANSQIPAAMTSTSSWHSEINVGVGLGGSGSIDIAHSGSSVGGYSGRFPGGRVGFAVGLAAGTGVSTTSTVPSLTIREMLESIPGVENMFRTQPMTVVSSHGIGIGVFR